MEFFYFNLLLGFDFLISYGTIVNTFNVVYMFMVCRYKPVCFIRENFIVLYQVFPYTILSTITKGDLSFPLTCPTRFSPTVTIVNPYSLFDCLQSTIYLYGCVYLYMYFLISFCMFIHTRFNKKHVKRDKVLFFSLFSL